MKPGIKTTEFWLTLLTLVLAGLAKSGALPVDFPVEAFGVVAAYALARALAKWNAQKAHDEGK